MPRKLGLSLARSGIKKSIGAMENYGLLNPDHEPLEAHPSVSGEFLTRAGCGDVKFKPAIKSLEGKRIRFEDDSVEDVDVLLFATGYERHTIQVDFGLYVADLKKEIVRGAKRASAVRSALPIPARV